ncbi:MAG: hypothetical protein ABWZ82_10255 [Candidatus Limnocylindrales bacterium]
MGAIAVLGTRSVAVAPGAQASVEIRVRNNGTVVDQFTVQVLGDAAPWSTAEPPVISLFPGAEQTARITFKPPRSPDVPAGPLAFGVRVASQEDPAGSVVEEGQLQVGAFSETSAELAPRTSRGRTSATHDLAIDNRGNTVLNASVAGLDPDRTLAYDIKPPAMVIDPGAAAFTKVAVKPRKRFWRGQPKTHSFQLQLDGGQAPVLVGGSMLQEPILPSWFLKALALLLAALVALVLIWLLFLQPAIRSAAEERAEEVLAAVGITPNPNPDPNGNGNGNGGEPTPTPGAGATTSPTTPTPTPGPAGVQTPRDGRLQAGGDALTPSADRTLFVTDLVFSNPDGTSGTLRLRRSGQDLFVLNLDNFRDLDFHFVTPIAVGPEQTLRLQCNGTCEGTPAVYFSGFER